MNLQIIKIIFFIFIIAIIIILNCTEQNNGTSDMQELIWHYALQIFSDYLTSPFNCLCRIVRWLQMASRKRYRRDVIRDILV